MYKLWNIETCNYFITTKKKYLHFIVTENVNLDKTLFIHIKCTDNTTPETVIHKKYNIYDSIMLYWGCCAWEVVI